MKISEKIMMNALQNSPAAQAAMAAAVSAIVEETVTAADIAEAADARIEALAARAKSSAASRKKRVAEASVRLADLLTKVLDEVHSPIDANEIAARLAEITEEEFTTGKITSVLSGLVKAGTVHKKVKRHEGVSRTHYYLAD